MKEIHVYYESKNNKENDSTNITIELFDSYKLAKEFMNKRRLEFINFGFIPDSIDGNGDKSWTRLYTDNTKKTYIDLIIAKKKIN